MITSGQSTISFQKAKLAAYQPNAECVPESGWTRWRGNEFLPRIVPVHSPWPRDHFFAEWDIQLQ